MINQTDTAQRPTTEAMAAAIALLKEANYQIVEQFVPRNSYREIDTEGLRIGCVLDTETTGKDSAVDLLIELGMVFFQYDPETGVVYDIFEVFNELQDPGIPIPPEATAVNGITDEMVKGKQIDPKIVTGLLEYVDVVIAHNASFDRVICERIWPVFATKAWACTFRQIDWQGEGISSAKLDYIAYKRGFHYAAHRAEVDCRATLHVLQGLMATTGLPTLKTLLGNHKAREMRIWAVDSPFSVKDALSKRGYYWGDGTNGKEKAWNISVPEADVEAELAWLKANAYNNKAAAVVVDTVDEFSRFSARRPGKKRQII